MTLEKPVDQQSAALFLVERYGAGVTDVAELGAGDWSRAFSFRQDDRDLVIRFGRHLDDFRKDQKAVAFTRAELPVPAVLEVGEALGGYYAVSERHFGTFLEALDECGWRTVIPALLRALDTLRGIEPPGSGIDWVAEPGSVPLRWREWLVASLEDRPGERVSGWREKLKRTPEIEQVFVSGERAMRALLPACPEDRHLVHSDLLNRNVLAAEDASRLEAVFDWGCSLAGDFLYEVAWFTFWSPWYPALESLDFRRVVRAHYETIGLQVESLEERLACYELHIGIGHLGYAAFSGREEHLPPIARRTLQVLQHAPR
jgi:hygromycin-B 4-O-kinase